MSTPSQRSVSQELPTAHVPRTAPSFSNLREPLFVPFSWPRTTNPTVWTSRRSGLEAPRISRSSTTSIQPSADQPLNLITSAPPRASASLELPPRVATLPTSEGASSSLVTEPSATATAGSMVHLEPRQISRIENPSSMLPTEVVRSSPKHSSTINILPLETAEVSLSSSSSSSTNEIFL